MSAEDTINLALGAAMTPSFENMAMLTNEGESLKAKILIGYIKNWRRQEWYAGIET